MRQCALNHAFHASAAAIPLRQPISARADAVVGPLFRRPARCCPSRRPGHDHGAAAVYTEANKAFGGIDILINDAGAYEARPWICS
jgi:NAD(P)-dependent dehydrogenase (short-subunit alcohol dehydrogenase family)